MGLNQGDQTKRTYINIVQGCFAKRVDANTQGAVKRVIKDKQTGDEKIVYEIYYRDIDAMINSVSVNTTGRHGDQLHIDMSDVDENFTIILPMGSREAKHFLCRLGNINLRQMVTLAPYNFESKDNGAKVIGMNVYQNGKGKEFKVKEMFGKDIIGEFPQVPQNTDKDDFKLIMKQQEIFLKKWVIKFAADHFPIPSTATTVAKPAPKKAKIAPNPVTSAPVMGDTNTPLFPPDDLPF